VRLSKHNGMDDLDFSGDLVLTKNDNMLTVAEWHRFGHYSIRNLYLYSVSDRWKSTFEALKFIWFK
jgi:hypothetical protein